MLVLTDVPHAWDVLSHEKHADCALAELCSEGLRTGLLLLRLGRLMKLSRFLAGCSALDS